MWEIKAASLYRGEPSDKATEDVLLTLGAPVSVSISSPNNIQKIKHKELSKWPFLKFIVIPSSKW